LLAVSPLPVLNSPVSSLQAPGMQEDSRDLVPEQKRPGQPERAHQPVPKTQTNRDRTLKKQDMISIDPIIQRP
jgi:hypothetical protein